MPAARKRKTKSKSQTRAKRGMSVRAKLFLAPFIVALPFAAHLVDADRNASGTLVAQPLSELVYVPDVAATASMRETFTLGSISYEVRGAVNRGSIFGFQNTEGAFIEAVIAAENIGTAPETPAAVTLVDKFGTQYAQKPQFSIEGDAYSEAIRRPLEPGTAGTFFVLFDVASGSEDLLLSFHGVNGVSSRLVPLAL